MGPHRKVGIGLFVKDIHHRELSIKGAGENLTKESLTRGESATIPSRAALPLVGVDMGGWKSEGNDLKNFLRQINRYTDASPRMDACSACLKSQGVAVLLHKMMWQICGESYHPHLN